MHFLKTLFVDLLVMFKSILLNVLSKNLNYWRFKKDLFLKLFYNLNSKLVGSNNEFLRSQNSQSSKTHKADSYNQSNLNSCGNQNGNSLSKSQSGQSLVEYLILVCIICVASISILRVVGQNINAKFSQVANSLQGKSANHGGVKMDEVRDSHSKKRDLSNFFQGASGRENKSNE